MKKGAFSIQAIAFEWIKESNNNISKELNELINLNKKAKMLKESSKNCKINQVNKKDKKQGEIQKYKQLKHELMEHEKTSIKIENKIMKIKPLIPSEGDIDQKKTLFIEIMSLNHRADMLKKEINICNTFLNQTEKNLGLEKNIEVIKITFGVVFILIITMIIISYISSFF